MVSQSKTIFLLEKLQPSYFQSKIDKIIYVIANFLFISTIIGISFWMLSSSVFEFKKALIIGFIFGVSTGLKVSSATSDEIFLYENLKWSWRRAKSKLIFSIGIGFVILIADMLVAYEPSIFILFRGSIISFVFFLISGVINGKVERRIAPNQGIYTSIKNGIAIGLISGFTAGMLISLSLGTRYGLLFGIIFGVNLFILTGGITAFCHYNLRLILSYKDMILFDYINFLNYISKILLMKKVGGGYVFYHRMLMEHFANMKLER